MQAHYSGGGGSAVRAANGGDIRAEAAAAALIRGGGDKLGAEEISDLRAEAAAAALRHDDIMRCRVAQLERQVNRANAELQVLSWTQLYTKKTGLKDRHFIGVARCV
jgi:hypothetical protein